MATKITGTNTAAAPGVTGDDTDTGLFYGTNEIGFSTGGTSRATVDSSGDLNILAGHLTLPDSKHIKLGNSSDFEIHHNTAQNWIENNGTFALGISVNNKAEYAAEFKANSGVDLYYDNSKKLETTSTGISVTGQVVATTNFKGADSVDLVLGTGSDFRILHDGTDNVLTSDGGQSIKLVNHLTGGNETMGKFIPNGAVELYHNGVEMFYTSASGCHVGRPSAAAHLHFLDGGIARFGAGNDLEIYHDGSHSRIVDSGTGNLMLQSDRLVIANANNSENMLVCDDDTTVELYYNGTKRFETNNSGAHCTGSLTADTFAVQDNEYFYAGNSDDLAIYFDGTHSYISNGGDDLIIRSADHIIIRTNNNENAVVCNKNGSTDLYYDNSQKFYTTSGGTCTLGNMYAEAGGICQTLVHTGTGELARFRANTSSTVGNITVSASSTTYNTSSDYRLKENTVPLSDGITRLKTLKPYRFNFKVEPSKTVDGFFAHEVTPAVPEAITGEKDASEMQQIDQSKLVPLLTAALQEAIGKIEVLETKVAALEAS